MYFHTWKTTLLVLIVYLFVDNTRQEVPMTLRKQLAAVNSTEELIRKFVKNKDDSRLQEGKIVITESTFECIPRATAVDLPSDPNPDVVYYPSCVELMRCAGCCNDAKLRCSATASRYILREVMKLQYTGDQNELTFVGYANILLEEHTACECSCAVTDNQCNPDVHWYDVDACLCRCNDYSQVSLCPAHKLWSETTCSCVCPQVSMCFDDEVFDFSSCSCRAEIQLLPSSDVNNSSAIQHDAGK